MGQLNAPPILPRSKWSTLSAGNFGHRLPAGPVGEWIAHHSIVPDLPVTATETAEARAMKAVHDYHVKQGYGGFGYQWAIFNSGRIWEGRGWGRTGAHTVGRNSRSIGLVWMVNGDLHMPSHEALEAARWLLIVGEVSGNVARSAPLNGHRRYSTKSCPGHAINEDALRYLRASVDGTYPHG